MLKPKLKPLTAVFSCLILMMWLFLSLSGCSTADSPKDFSRLASLKSSSFPGINSIRLTALKQTARGLGAQAGLAWRSKQINAILKEQRRQLNRIFNFNYLTLEHNVLPPVLEEGRNTLNLADASTIRISDRDYQIVYPPRFVTAPPSWHDYIWMQYKKPEVPNHTLLPKNSDEKKVWNEYISIGWNEGVSQANEIFTANLGRLQRDFSGMILYRKLLAQNMVTKPFVSEADLGITGDGTSMRINDRVLRITSVSELKTNSKAWNPAMVEERDEGGPKIVIQRKGKDKI